MYLKVRLLPSWIFGWSWHPSSEGHSSIIFSTIPVRDGAAREGGSVGFGSFGFVFSGTRPGVPVFREKNTGSQVRAICLCVSRVSKSFRFQQIGLIRLWVLAGQLSSGSGVIPCRGGCVKGKQADYCFCLPRFVPCSWSLSCFSF